MTDNSDFERYLAQRAAELDARPDHELSKDELSRRNGQRFAEAIRAVDTGPTTALGLAQQFVDAFDADSDPESAA